MGVGGPVVLCAPGLKSRPAPHAVAASVGVGSVGVGGRVLLLLLLGGMPTGAGRVGLDGETRARAAVPRGLAAKLGKRKVGGMCEGKGSEGVLGTCLPQSVLSVPRYHTSTRGQFAGFAPGQARGELYSLPSTAATFELAVEGGQAVCTAGCVGRGAAATVASGLSLLRQPAAGYQRFRTAGSGRQSSALGWKLWRRSPLADVVRRLQHCVRAGQQCQTLACMAAAPRPVRAVLQQAAALWGALLASRTARTFAA